MSHTSCRPEREVEDNAPIQPEPTPFAKYAWCNRSPPKVQFFIWFLSQKSNSLQTQPAAQRDCLTTPPATCAIKLMRLPITYIIFDCPFATSFWSSLGVSLDPTPSAHHLWDMSRPVQIGSRQFIVFIHLCCWNLWKHRHHVVFRDVPPSLPHLQVT